MLRAVVCLMLALQSAVAPLCEPEGRVICAMKTGILLRMHVVAQDDTPEMQGLKLSVRDAVRDAYDERRSPAGFSMLVAAEALLPELTETAVAAARREGFAGAIAVTIENAAFDARELDGYLIPAGNYPALMIRLGDAKGHNWWGLIDPELSLRAASVPDAAWEDAIEWDWSLQALLSALLGLSLTTREGNDA